MKKFNWDLSDTVILSSYDDTITSLLHYKKKRMSLAIEFHGKDKDVTFVHLKDINEHCPNFRKYLMNEITNLMLILSCESKLAKMPHEDTDIYVSDDLICLSYLQHIRPAFYRSSSNFTLSESQQLYKLLD